MKKAVNRAACVTGFAALLMMPGAALAQSEPGGPTNHGTTTKSTISGSDSKFVTEAAQGGMAEVELGRLAAEKASSADVKKFGQRMVDDHTKAGDQLKQVAAQKNITLPTGVGSKNQAEINKLSKLGGADFDHAYMRLMVQDHRKDVAEFRKEANSGKDADVKNFASNTLPTLEDHLKNAESVAAEEAGHSADRMKTTQKTTEKTTTTEKNH
jgi:putative membrane protein